MKIEHAECSETSAYKIHTPGNNPKKEYNINNMAKVGNQEEKHLCNKKILSQR